MMPEQVTRLLWWPELLVRSLLQHSMARTSIGPALILDSSADVESTQFRFLPQDVAG